MFELWRQCCVNCNYSSQQFCKSCVMHLLSEKPGWSIWLAEEKFYSWVLFISLYKREMRKSQQNKSLSQIPWYQSRAGERILASGSKQIPDLTSEKASAFCICCRVLSSCSSLCWWYESKSALADQYQFTQWQWFEITDTEICHDTQNSQQDSGVIFCFIVGATSNRWLRVTW